MDAAEVVGFAEAYDPQWFHVDPEAAERGRFGGLIASGWHTCGIAMRLVADAALTGSESYASPGLEYVTWPHPERPGDALRLRAEVLETRVSRSQPWLGILRWCCATSTVSKCWSSRQLTCSIWRRPERQS